ncbi:hypothetical protein GQ600_20833 [Phytophthora cactorum]|nr:hypothetical protein GQ600_20833 [Phytophthora cactorum]
MGRDRWGAASTTNESAIVRAHLEVVATDGSTSAAPPSLRRRTLHRLAAGADPRTRVAAGRGRNRSTRKRRENTEALKTRSASTSPRSPRRKERRKTRGATVGTDTTTARPLSSDSDTVRSAISGKKIKRKLDRSATDLQNQKSRQQLLQFYNGMFD